ncbi:hypothetical protein BC628DRAFT_204874 [Trametes gibbosa]|nr:hypothetical protein BC628DRAFT_204874 [Trametes gibbosa]
MGETGATTGRQGESEGLLGGEGGEEEEGASCGTGAARRQAIRGAPRSCGGTPAKHRTPPASPGRGNGARQRGYPIDVHSAGRTGCSAGRVDDRTNGRRCSWREGGISYHAGHAGVGECALHIWRARRNLPGVRARERERRLLISISFESPPHRRPDRARGERDAKPASERGRGTHAREPDGAPAAAASIRQGGALR